MLLKQDTVGSPCTNFQRDTTGVHLAGGMGEDPRGPGSFPFLIQFKLCPQILKSI